jgi:hypothetical protein
MVEAVRGDGPGTHLTDGGHATGPAARSPRGHFQLVLFLAELSKTCNGRYQAGMKKRSRQGPGEGFRIALTKAGSLKEWLGNLPGTYRG